LCIKKLWFINYTSIVYCIGTRRLDSLEKLPFGQTISIATYEGSYLELSLPRRNKKLDKYQILKEVFKSYKALHIELLGLDFYAIDLCRFVLTKNRIDSFIEVLEFSFRTNEN
jgi:hypothetical protein